MAEQVTTLLIDRPQVLVVAFVVVLLRFVWFCFWILALVVLIFCFFWSCQVFANTIQVIAADVLNRWYFNEHMYEPVKHSTTHACTYVPLR